MHTRTRLAYVVAYSPGMKESTGSIPVSDEFFQGHNNASAARLTTPSTTLSPL